MSARTLAWILCCVTLAAPLRALATPSVISQYTQISSPYSTLYGTAIDIAAPSTFVATGTLTTLSLPLASSRGLTGAELFSFQLMNYYSTSWIDCKTPEKSADEWGITHTAKDPNAPMITIGPFSGTQCAIALNDDERQDRTLWVMKSGVEYGGLGLMGRNYHANFTAYGPDVAPPAPPDPCASRMCADSVLFLPGLEASRLYMRTALGTERELWEPSIYTDVPELALNADGTSVNQVYTRDIVDSLYGNTAVSGAVKSVLGSRAEVYGSFGSFLDGLVASSTLRMTEWRAYPYDWRYDVRDIVENGTLTDVNGTLQTVYLANVLTEMASSSATGKVTIVAHSNGGLLAKALIDKLQTLGKANLVAKLITVGTPHWGTPTDIGALLHGDGGTRGLGLITYAGSVREAGKTMPGTYGLLPSSSYFSAVANPVVSFEGTGLTEGYASAFANGIRSLSDLTSFLADSHGLNGSVGDASSLNVPLVLSPDLLAHASALHSSFDTWNPPAGIAVTSIAGWGQLTTYGYRYEEAEGHKTCHWEGLQNICSREKVLTHTALKTEDGDDTVIEASAVGNLNGLYFDVENYGERGNVYYQHQNLTAASPIQQTILGTLMGAATNQESIVVTKPSGTKSPLTRVGARSPINIVITDQSGRRTGILSVPGVDGIYADLQEIPGSAVDASGDEKYVYVPTGSSYTVTVNGYATGTANIEIATLDSSGNVTERTTVADLPVTPSSTGSLTISASNTLSAVTLDSDGNGSVDITVTPTAGELVPYEAPQAVAGAGSTDTNWTMTFSEPVAAVLEEIVATTTAEVIATTTPRDTLELEPLVALAPATTPKLAAQKPIIPKLVKERPTAQKVDQTPQLAAAYEGVSVASRSGFGEMLYHWIVRVFDKMRSVF